MDQLDVIIIGGGPAGMSAALVLGRCRRKILIFDKGNQRNKMARQMHAFLSRDGIAPEDFREAALRDLDKYYISIHKKAVAGLSKEKEGFRITDEDGNIFLARRVLVATGICDEIPDIPDFEEYYGTSIHHCPICDGWEVRDKSLVIYGSGAKVAEAALYLSHWSQDLKVIDSGEARLSDPCKAELRKRNIPIIDKQIVKLEGKQGWLRKIRFKDGEEIECEALFFATGYRVHWSVPEQLNCRYKKKGEIWTDRNQQSSVEGLYVAGDAAWEMKLVINAAADGAKAGVAIHNSIYKEDSEK